VRTTEGEYPPGARSNPLDDGRASPGSRVPPRVLLPRSAGGGPHGSRPARLLR
jgi:hypothetical protein